MSPPPVEYRVFGNIAVHEKCRDSGDPEAIESDVAIIALGWESRFTAFGDHLRLKAKKIVVLDFALQDTGISAVDANREKLASLANGWGVEVLVVNLEPSTEYQKNINILDHALAQLAEPCGSYQGTLRRVFVECSTMPRIYIQWLVAFAFKRLAIQSLEFGYAEGVYTSTGGKDDFSSGLDRYVTVPHLQGGGGMGEEKVLLVGIGGDADVFYGLIDLVSPERISLLVPRSQKHAAIDTLLDQQVSKVRETHRLEGSRSKRHRRLRLGRAPGCVRKLSRRVRTTRGHQRIRQRAKSSGNCCGSGGMLRPTGAVEGAYPDVLRAQGGRRRWTLSPLQADRPDIAGLQSAGHVLDPRQFATATNRPKTPPPITFVRHGSAFLEAACLRAALRTPA